MILLDALESKYKADIAVAKGNIFIFLTNPTAVGGHADIVETTASLIEQISAAEESLKTVQKIRQELKTLESNSG